MIPAHIQRRMPRPTDALSVWFMGWVEQRAQTRRTISPWVVRAYTLAVRILAEDITIRSSQVHRFAAHHTRAVLSMPTSVIKCCRACLGWLRVDRWRQRLGFEVRGPTPVSVALLVGAQVALLVLVFAAQVAAVTHPSISGISLAAVFTGTTIFEVESGGDDTNNGGAFDGFGNTAGMFTDGAATSANTSAPVFTSASYNFVAGDVGAWVYIASGTNWTPGWYKISSVAANAATLNGTIGSAVGSTGKETSPVIPSTVVGCATVTSPTTATWSIDYSQQTTAKFAYTDLASAGAGLTVSSAAKPFAKEQVGNCLVVTSGTNFTAGRYIITSVASGVATVRGPANITTGVGSAGVGGQGGCLASLGKAGAHVVANNQCFVWSATYTSTSASTNVAAGCFSSALTELVIEGYATVRGDLLPIGASGTRPTLIADGVITTFTLINATGTGSVSRSLIVDGNNRTSSRGINGNVTNSVWCHGQNFTNTAFGQGSAIRCTATGCATTHSAFSLANGNAYASIAYSNTVSGIGGSTSFFSLSVNNSGATSDGFRMDTAYCATVNCATYNNGRNGFTSRTSSHTNIMTNCLAESNAAWGWDLTNSLGPIMINCAAYNNTSGTVTSTSADHASNLGFITLTASAFTNAAGNDFSLNNTAGGGALCRAAGYPGVLPYGGTGYLDVGALQHADPAAAAAVLPFITTLGAMRL